MKIRTPLKGLWLSLLFPITLYVGSLIFGACIGYMHQRTMEGIFILFIFASLFDVPTFILLRKFWNLNKDLTINFALLDKFIELNKENNQKIIKKFSDVDHAILVTCPCWARTFWRGDGGLPWEWMHYATIFFLDGEKVTITTLLVTDITELLKQMGVSKIKHIVKYFPYPTKETI